MPSQTITVSFALKTTARQFRRQGAAKPDENQPKT
jgi:hypothetical protein